LHAASKSLGYSLGYSLGVCQSPRSVGSSMEPAPGITVPGLWEPEMQPARRLGWRSILPTNTPHPLDAQHPRVSVGLGTRHCCSSMPYTPPSASNSSMSICLSPSTAASSGHVREACPGWLRLSLRSGCWGKGEGYEARVFRVRPCHFLMSSLRSCVIVRCCLMMD